MKNQLVLLLVGVISAGLFSSCSQREEQSASCDLTIRWDTLRPLANPDKGWYHHMYDNGIDRYLIGDTQQFLEFPGMDHLYLRLCWAFLEPVEGEFDWSYIDDIVEKYVPLGFKVSFRITCKETGPAPTSVPYEIDGVRYATPNWVRQAGAKGVVPDKYGSASWTPDWLDPVFLGKLDNFHRAFAARYDGQPWVRYIDVGSIGDWGEGQTYFSTRIPPTVEEVKAHMDLYMKNYHKTQLVVTDDLLYWNKKEYEVQELFEYAREMGFTLRDDSPLVAHYVENYLDTWTVSHPHFFEEIYTSKPVIFELEHFHTVVSNGCWLGENGEDTIPGPGESGAEIFRNAMQYIRPTYIGFHGHIGEWLAVNPDLTGELLNLCGYWYFPVKMEVHATGGDTVTFSIDWLNKGVAPAYNPYGLAVKLIDIENEENQQTVQSQDSGNLNWMPGETVNQRYSIPLAIDGPGRYNLFVQLQDQRSGRMVEIGLKDWLKDRDGFYRIGQVEIKQRQSEKQEMPGRVASRRN